MLEKLRKEKKNILISICIGIFIALIMSTKSYSYSIQKGISEEIIRLHVLANSDLEEDQDLKIIVKNEIINLLEKELKESKSKDETKKNLEKNLDRITAKAEEVIKENGYSYKVNTKLTKAYFPTKVYGDVSLPSGEYDALQVIIGEAKGQNWWCVMFPPLCFVDVTLGEVPLKDKLLLKNLLSEEEYKLITTSEEDITVKIKFKIVEVWQKLIKKLEVLDK